MGTHRRTDRSRRRSLGFLPKYRKMASIIPSYWSNIFVEIIGKVWKIQNTFFMEVCFGLEPFLLVRLTVIPARAYHSNIAKFDFCQGQRHAQWMGYANNIPRNKEPVFPQSALAALPMLYGLK
jgi:hypothetical protein